MPEQATGHNQMEVLGFSPEKLKAIHAELQGLYDTHLEAVPIRIRDDEIQSISFSLEWPQEGTQGAVSSVVVASPNGRTEDLGVDINKLDPRQSTSIFLRQDGSKISSSHGFNADTVRDFLIHFDDTYLPLIKDSQKVTALARIVIPSAKSKKAPFRGLIGNILARSS